MILHFSYPSHFPNPSIVQRMAAVKLWLEMEIGITGGEEVGVSPALALAQGAMIVTWNST